jgi:hypothetical protein
MNIDNLLAVAALIRESATLREESRGSHYRDDFPHTGRGGLYNIHVRRGSDGEIVSERRAVQFTRRRPEDLQGDTLLPMQDAVSRAATLTTEL